MRDARKSLRFPAGRWVILAIASHLLIGGEHCLLVAKLPGHTIAPPEMRD